jgi:hypothetical protein
MSIATEPPIMTNRRAAADGVTFSMFVLSCGVNYVFISL